MSANPNKKSRSIPNQLAAATLLAFAATNFSGCAALRNPLGVRDDSTDLYAAETVNPIMQVSGESNPGTANEVVRADGSLTEKTKQTTKSVTNFLTGREQEDQVQAKQFYKEGDRLFKLASSQPTEQRKATFAKAAKQFKKAGESAPGSALEQDSMFMRAESYFFADQLTQATDTYEKLQKEFPRNRHNDRVAARLFSVSRYWIETAKANEGSWIPLNLTDSSRPRLDADGHAIRVLDQIRYDDPTGRLADDATMAAAAEYIRQEKYEDADEFLTDLRETFSDSEHLFLAHMLGVQCKLEIYAGPKYSGLILDEAEKLVQQTRARYPEKLNGTEHGEMIARAARTIEFHRAETLAEKASFREKRKEYRAAGIYYHELLEKYGDTPQAEIARQRLTKIEKLPAVPTQRLSWLTTIFPESRPRNPLKMDLPVETDSSGPSGSIYR
ncbi:MAG: tetratricopeptide repeat protein [Rubripirellula sp.]